MGFLVEGESSRSGLGIGSAAEPRRDKGDAVLGPPFAKFGAPFPNVCINFDVVGEDSEIGLRISLDADTPVCKLPFRTLTSDLLFAGGPPIGEGYDPAGPVVVGVDGRDMTEL